MINLKGRWASAFTLIELMIVVSIIGILASIAIPKFADMIRKAEEGATKGNLGAVRSALNIYYADMEGQIPSDFNSLTVNGKYLSAIPTFYAPFYHPPSSTAQYQTNGISGNPLETEYLAYVYLLTYLVPNSLPMSSYPGGPLIQSGTVFVLCTHTDTKGSVWDSY